MARDGASNVERFPYRKGHCRFCRQPLAGRRRTFCSDACVQKFLMKTSWKLVRRVVYKRDKGICQICGSKVPRRGYHVDHIVPISKGGDEWELDNLQLACPQCNLTKSNKTEEEDE